MTTSSATASHDLIDDHDQGLSHDLAMIERLKIGRRRALSWLGSAGGTALLAGCGGEKIGRAHV